MDTTNKVDKFGKFLVDNLRDKGIEFADKLLQNHWKAPAFQTIQAELYELSDSKKKFIKEAIIATIDNAIHDFLFALQEINDIKILVDGENIVELSDGIHGEAFSDEGWYTKYSKFKTVF
jgi:hypothetical protein